MVENFDEFNERIAIYQTFSYQPSFNVSPLKPTISSSKFCLSSFSCQSFSPSSFCAIQYTHLIQDAQGVKSCVQEKGLDVKVVKSKWVDEEGPCRLMLILMEIKF